MIGPAIVAAPVERDEMGFWAHPAWPDDDECEESIPLSWFAERGLQVRCFDFESDAPEELQDAWLELGEYDCSKWEPSKPGGDGWFVFSIHDTDDGPICVWVRPAPGAAIER